MKTKFILLLSTFLLGLGFSGYGQRRIEQAFELGLEDADKVMRAYLSPLGESMGFLQAEGWVFTARPLKRFQFNVHVNLNVMRVPQSARSFSVRELGLNNVVLPDGINDAPTIFGSPEAGPSAFNTVLGDSIAFPQGIGNLIPLPVPQFNIGLGHNTELMVRFFPPIPIEFANVGIYAAGIKHDLKQWIPAIALSNFSLSLIANYSYLRFNYGLDVINAGDARNQEFIFTNRQWSLGLVASKKLPLLTFFGGLRYDNSNSTARFRGSFLVPDANGNVEVINIEDFNLLNQTYQGGRIGLTGGAKVKIWKLFAFGSATLSTFSTFNLGIGLGFND